MSKGDEREFLFSFFFLLFAWMNLEKNFTQSSTTKVDQQLSTLLSFFFSYFIGRSFLFLFLLYTSVRPVTAPFVVCWPLSFFNWIAHDIPSPCRRRYYRKKKKNLVLLQLVSIWFDSFFEKYLTGISDRMALIITGRTQNYWKEKKKNTFLAMFHLLFLYADCACRSYFGCPIHRAKPLASSLTSYGRALWMWHSRRRWFKVMLRMM